MASAVDICNLGLSNLGDEATVVSITPPEGSAQAEHCKRYYPIARDAVLEMHTWSFATKRKALALTSDTPPDSWLYVYATPSDCLAAKAVYAPGVIDDKDTQDFVQEVLEDGTKVIYTNVEDATLRYVTLVTDTTKFSPLFVLALGRFLSSLLSGPVIKGETGMDVATKQMNYFLKIEFPNAVAADANAVQSDPYKTFTPAGIAARA